MGCLNSGNDGKGFDHWFSNIHFSGPCNRACYFCIGQWMPGQDPNNNLDLWPLHNIDKYVDELKKRNIKEINLTGTNTDPSLYKHTPELIEYLRKNNPGAVVGIRTNGALVMQQLATWDLFDKASVSITSFNPEIYKKTMGSGHPPDIFEIAKVSKGKNLKVNIVICPENLENNGQDLINTLNILREAGITRINLREPYGQEHIGNKVVDKIIGKPVGERLGMPRYNYKGMDVMYWDVHYVHVESINLYADGHISTDYPVTLGHSPVLGEVHDQDYYKNNFGGHGRQQPQWVGTKKEKRPMGSKEHIIVPAVEFNIDKLDSNIILPFGDMALKFGKKGDEIETKLPPSTPAGEIADTLNKLPNENSVEFIVSKDSRLPDEKDLRDMVDIAKDKEKKSKKKGKE